MCHRIVLRYQWCGLNPSVLLQDQSWDQKNRSWSRSCRSDVVLCCVFTWFYYVHHHNALEGYSNFSSTICSFFILCLEHHYCGDQQCRSLTYLKVKSANCFCLFLWFWSWSCYFRLGLGLQNFVLFTSLSDTWNKMTLSVIWSSYGDIHNY